MKCLCLCASYHIRPDSYLVFPQDPELFPELQNALGLCKCSNGCIYYIDYSLERTAICFPHPYLFHFIHTFTLIHTYLYTYTCIHRVYTQMQTQGHVHAKKHTLIHTCKHTCIHTLIHKPHKHNSTDMHTDVHTDITQHTHTHTIKNFTPSCLLQCNHLSF